ncbi:uncharacterized protein LOC141597528 [Silene latifolia]|uniref:uncharacterized protein LOC141597528 n=1 Tax=Silene latifolia TaxID=37657 RepID=UPI003D777C61
MFESGIVGKAWVEISFGRYVSFQQGFSAKTVWDSGHCYWDTAFGHWNELFIRALFREEHAERILATRVRASKLIDEVYWPFTKHGVFTVKSGYGLIFEEYMTRKGTLKDSTRLGTRGRAFCRKQLWTLPVPNTWKILIWRIITNTLSVGKELQQRNMVTYVFCGLCGDNHTNLETVEHLFRDCELSARIWAGSGLGIKVEGAKCLNMTDWIIDWIRNLQVLSGFLFDSISERVRILYDQVDGKGLMKGSRVDASWERSFKAVVGWVAYDELGRECMRRQVSTKAESALQAEVLGICDVLVWASSGGEAFTWTSHRIVFNLSTNSRAWRRQISFGYWHPGGVAWSCKFISLLMF